MQNGDAVVNGNDKCILNEGADCSGREGNESKRLSFDPSRYLVPSFKPQKF